MFFVCSVHRDRHVKNAQFKITMWSPKQKTKIKIFYFPMASRINQHAIDLKNKYPALLDPVSSSSAMAKTGTCEVLMQGVSVLVSNSRERSRRVKIDTSITPEQKRSILEAESAYRKIVKAETFLFSYRKQIYADERSAYAKCLQKYERTHAQEDREVLMGFLHRIDALFKNTLHIGIIETYVRPFIGDLIATGAHETMYGGVIESNLSVMVNNERMFNLKKLVKGLDEITDEIEFKKCVTGMNIKVLNFEDFFSFSTTMEASPTSEESKLSCEYAPSHMYSERTSDQGCY